MQHGTNPQRTQPLAAAPRAAWRGVRGVLTDIDDTLTRDGAIEPAARVALRELAAAGLPVVAITGRPMGWSEPFVRDGTLDTIVAENGAGAWYRQGDAVLQAYVQDAATRADNAHRLLQVAERVLRDVPGATLARDSAGRVTDIAIDHSEFAQLDAGAVQQVVAIMRQTFQSAEATDKQDRSAIEMAGRVIEDVLSHVHELSMNAERMRTSGSEIRGEVERLTMDLQFQDRISQVLSVVERDVERLREGARDPRELPAPQAWLADLQAGYTMQAQRANHTDAPTTAAHAGGAAAGVEFF